MSNDVSQNGIKVNTSSSVYAYKMVSMNKLKHEYEIIVSRDYIEQKMNSRLREIAKNAKFPGFRSGKTPYSLVVANYKDEALKRIASDAIEYCSSDLAKKIKVKSYLYPKVDIVSLPDLNKRDQKMDFIYRLSFELMPEIPVIDLSKISLKKINVKIENDDIEEFINSMKKEFSDFISVNDDSYKAKDGDKLVVDFEGRIKNKLFQGGTNKNFSINLGSGKFISDFENHLIGVKRGEIKSFKIKLPKDYRKVSLAEQEATFSVRVNDIMIMKSFTSNNEIARKAGFNNYYSLKVHVKKVISDQCKKMIDALIKKELFDFLDSNYNFDLPTETVKLEQQRVEKELDHKNNSCREAKRRVKLAMLFMKLSAEHKILLTKDDISNVIMNHYVNKDLTFNRALRHFSSNKKFQDLIKGQALEHKITGFIIEKVSKEEQIISVKWLKKLFNSI